MEVIKIYVAEDGRRFSNEGDCLEHEEDLHAVNFKDTALMFDKDGHLLPLRSSNFSDCVFLVCKTEEAVAYVDEAFRGWFLPWESNGRDKTKPGTWFFDGDNWREIAELLEIAEIAKHILKV